MSREQRIVATFVEFADALVDEFDVADFLHRLVLRCVELLDCVDVGLMLVDPHGVPRVMASASERSETLDVLQSQAHEGPCYECCHSGLPVFCDNLTAASDRWPEFAPSAVRAGFASVEAVPLRVRREAVGALNLFRAEPGRIDLRDLPLAQGLADLAAVALLQERAVREARGVVEQLHGALTSRVVIEQAKGVLAERAQITVDAAFGRLRGYARAHNRLLGDVCLDVIADRLDLHG